MDALPVVIYVARTARDADLLKMRLAEAQIDAQRPHDSAAEASPWRVAVKPDKAEDAWRVALAFERDQYGLVDLPEDGAVGVQGDWLFNPVEIYSAGSVPQAYMLRNLLAESGIVAVVANSTLHGGGVDLVGLHTAAKVMVAQKNAAAARRFALQFDDAAVAAAEFPPEPDPLSDSTYDWPRCPGCGERRSTRCKICHTSGTDFNLADMDFVGPSEPGEKSSDASDTTSCGCGPTGCGGGNESCEDTAAQDPSDATVESVDQPPPRPEPLLMCPTCDEPFVPAFPRLCEWCGHQFDDGYEIETHTPPPVEQISSRAVLVIAGLLLVLALAFVYFTVIV